MTFVLADLARDCFPDTPLDKTNAGSLISYTIAGLALALKESAPQTLLLDGGEDSSGLPYFAISRASGTHRKHLRIPAQQTEIITRVDWQLPNVESIASDRPFDLTQTEMYKPANAINGPYVSRDIARRLTAQKLTCIFLETAKGLLPLTQRDNLEKFLTTHHIAEPA